MSEEGSVISRCPEVVVVGGGLFFPAIIVVDSLKKAHVETVSTLWTINRVATLSESELLEIRYTSNGKRDSALLVNVIFVTLPNWFMSMMFFLEWLLIGFLPSTYSP